MAFIRGFILSLWLLAGIQLAAAEAPFLEKYPTDLSYKHLEEVVEPKLADEVLSQINPHLTGEGLLPVSRDEQGNRHSVFYMDEVLADFESGRAILVKIGAEPSDPKVMNALLQDEEGVLFHSRSPSGIPYVIYFMNIERSQIQAMVSSVQGDFQNSESTSLFSNLSPITSAHAGTQDYYRRPPLFGTRTRAPTSPPEVCDAQKGHTDRTVNQIESEIRDPKAKKKEQNKFVRIVLGCGTGIKDALKGLTVGTYEGIRDFSITVGKETVNFFNHPFKTIGRGLTGLYHLPGKLWDGAVGMFKGSKKNKAEDWASIICKVSTYFSAGMVIGYLATGKIAAGANAKKFGQFLKTTSDGNTLQQMVLNPQDLGKAFRSH